MRHQRLVLQPVGGGGLPLLGKRRIPVEIAKGQKLRRARHLLQLRLVQMLEHLRFAQMGFQTAFAVQPVNVFLEFRAAQPDFPKSLPAYFQHFRRTIHRHRGRARRPAQGGDLAKQFACRQDCGSVFRSELS